MTSPETVALPCTVKTLGEVFRCASPTDRSGECAGAEAGLGLAGTCNLEESGSLGMSSVMSMSWLSQPSVVSWLHRLGNVSLEVMDASDMLVLVSHDINGRQIQHAYSILQLTKMAVATQSMKR